MKFIISNNTITELNIQSAAAMRELGITEDSISLLAAPPAEITDLANISVTQADGDWTLEVNDEVLFKYLRVYIRIAQVVMPFIKPVKNLVFTLKDELAQIEEFIIQRKQ